MSDTTVDRANVVLTCSENVLTFCEIATDSQAEFLLFVPGFSGGKWDFCIDPLEAAAKLTHDSTPRPDGIPCAFWPKAPQ